MKKNRTKDEEQKPRRLRLSRETILVLDDLALLGLAKGGSEGEDPCPTGSSKVRATDVGGG
jgi:hypothetical protein